MKQNLNSLSFKSNEEDKIIRTKQLEQIRKKLIKGRKEKKIPFLSIIDDDKDLLALEDILDAFKTFNKIIVIGTGGSSLGGKTFVDSVLNDRVIFIENIDTKTLKKILKKVIHQETGIIAISKSGKTMETIAVSAIIFKIFDKVINLTKHAFVITENIHSELYQIAKNYNIRVIPHASNLGGRFSCLSSTALLPAALAGIDVRDIKSYSKSVLNNMLKDIETEPFQGADAMISLFESKKYSNQVLLVYGDALWSLVFWFRQLWAESLGKNGRGTHPIPAIGAIDQHSQLQLWLDGPDNTIYSIIILQDDPRSMIIPSTEGIPKYLKNKRLSNVLNKMAHSTVEALIDAGRPVRIIEIEDSSPKTIVKLMVTFMLETVILADLLNINAYDQPAVEKIKIRTKELLKNE